jgi:hypothetical protein
MKISSQDRTIKNYVTSPGRVASRASCSLNIYVCSNFYYDVSFVGGYEISRVFCINNTKRCERLQACSSNPSEHTITHMNAHVMIELIMPIMSISSLQ